jgi:nicotinamidase-related amidase
MSSLSTLPGTTALLVIDVQQAFDNPSWGQRNNPDAEDKIATLLAGFRHHNLPIVHIHHRNPAAGSLFNPGSPGLIVKPQAQPLPGEPVLYKRVNSGFIGTDLEARLRADHIDTVVIVGLTTDHCCSTTTRMAGNLDFNTYLIADATATFGRTSPKGQHYTADQMHDTALTSLSGEFATILTTDELLRSLPHSNKKSDLKELPV